MDSCKKSGSELVVIYVSKHAYSSGDYERNDCWNQQLFSEHFFISVLVAQVLGNSRKYSKHDRHKYLDAVVKKFYFATYCKACIE